MTKEVRQVTAEQARQEDNLLAEIQSYEDKIKQSNTREYVSAVSVHLHEARRKYVELVGESCIDNDGNTWEVLSHGEIVFHGGGVRSSR